MSNFDTATAVQDRLLKAIGNFTWTGTGSSDLSRFIDYIIQETRPTGPDGVDPDYRDLAREHCEVCENSAWGDGCRRGDW